MITSFVATDNEENVFPTNQKKCLKQFKNGFAGLTPDIRYNNLLWRKAVRIVERLRNHVLTLYITE